MPKKRKTRQQKKILQLKRELERIRYQKSQAIKTKKPTPLPLRKKALRKKVKKQEISLQPEYDEKLIKGDLLKTLLLAALFVALILAFYFQPTILKEKLPIF